MNNIYCFYKELPHHLETCPLLFSFHNAYMDTETPRAAQDPAAPTYTTETPMLPAPPTVPICEARSVSSAKRPHPPSSPSPIPETSDDSNYNLEDTLAQIQATMTAEFSSLQQDITTLWSQIIALTTTNHA